MKKIILIVCIIICFITISAPVYASSDEPLPGSMTPYNGTFAIMLPNTDEPYDNPLNLCLNLLSSNYPGYGTNLTKAPYTGGSPNPNGTQWYKRLYYTVSGTTYYAWGCYNDPLYTMNCRRADSTGSYVNVVPTTYNPRGDLNIHSPSCMSVSGTYFLGAPPRSYQTNIMVVWKTSESTGYSNNTYLIWRAHVGIPDVPTQHSFYINANTGAFLIDYFAYPPFNRYRPCPHGSI